MEPGSDAMKQRMQAMMRYNRLRQETRASNAVLQVKRKHQRREPVDPRATRPRSSGSRCRTGRTTSALRDRRPARGPGPRALPRGPGEPFRARAGSEARPIEEDMEEGEDDDERRREKARRRRKAGMRDIRVHPAEVDELDHRAAAARCRAGTRTATRSRCSRPRPRTCASCACRSRTTSRPRSSRARRRSRWTSSGWVSTTLTPVDFAKYPPRAARGSTLAWCKAQQGVRTSARVERALQDQERVKRAEDVAEDPCGPPKLQSAAIAEVALVANRCGPTRCARPATAWARA